MSENDSTTSSGYDKTEPAPLDDLNRQARINHEFGVVRKHHARIADSIQLFWGHPECDEFIQKLIFNAGDEYVRARAGFKPEILEAIMNLSNLHVVIVKTSRQSP
jgi:hypothetical protein